MNTRSPASMDNAPIPFSPSNFTLWFLDRGERWGAAWTRHFAHQWVAYLLLFALFALLFKHYSFALNGSTSLPFKMFVVEKNAPVTRGDYVAFRWHGAGPFAEGTTFGKQVVGIEGDTVTQSEREFFVNGKSFGKAKLVSKTGVSLEIGPTGVIPQGRLYVHAPHPDSLDSRYAWSGWIPTDRVIGKIIWKY